VEGAAVVRLALVQHLVARLFGRESGLPSLARESIRLALAKDGWL
jgi:hypothetical protein